MSLLARSEILGLLIHWFPMSDILAITPGIYRNQIKWIYLNNQKRFVNILLDFYNLYEI